MQGGPYHRKNTPTGWLTFHRYPNSNKNSEQMNIDLDKMKIIVKEWKENIVDDIPERKLVYLNSLMRKFEFLVKGDNS